MYLGIKTLYHSMRLITLFTLVLFPVSVTFAGELYIGSSVADITPALPVALDGQMHLRIARTVETQLEANILALESREGGTTAEIVVFVSCDLVAVPSEMLEMVKTEVHKILPELDVNKIVINATHTHTAPVVRKGLYPVPEKGVTTIPEYHAFFARQVGAAVFKAWKGRVPGTVTWGLGHAKTGYNRRAVYADGSAQMYGKTGIPEFRSIEGPEDQNVNALFCWDINDRLIAVSISVACTAQEVEHRNAVNADYWHPLRVALRERFGSGLAVIGWISAAGDQSPHILYGSAGEARMLKLRNIEGTDEIARRILLAVDDIYNVVVNDKHNNVPLVHKYETLSLPMRIVTEQEYEKSKMEIESLNAQIISDQGAKERLFRRIGWEGDVIKRFELQKKEPHPVYKARVHVIRIGDIVVCTNPFELFTSYGIAMQARSKAVQTFVVQLAGPGTYLPTGNAVTGGGYSAIVESTLVGPEGGQKLVDQTIRMIDGLWVKPE